MDVYLFVSVAVVAVFVAVVWWSTPGRPSRRRWYTRPRE